MSISDGERLATLEAQMGNVRGDVGDIKDSIKALEKIAAQGGGALHTILIIGGFIGWLAGLGAMIYGVLHR